MNLSTFNSKNVLIIFFGIFIPYNVFLVYKKPEVLFYQSQVQRNYAYSQEFIYENTASTVIVGTSMAARMEKEFFPPEVFNLSFAGGSVITGLEVIKQSGQIPKRILIETNIIFKEADQSMLDSLFYPVFSKVKKYVPAFRDKYQPLNLILSHFKPGHKKSHEHRMEIEPDELVCKRELKRHIENYSKSLEYKKRNLERLRLLVKYFQEKGVEIQFFEVPMHKTLVDSQRLKETRSAIRENFDIPWVQVDPEISFTTTDGLHLLYRSAYKFSRILISRIEDKQ